MRNQPELEKCAVILLWFCGFALVGAGIIVWLVCSVTRTPKVVAEYSIQKLDPAVDWSQHTNAYAGYVLAEANWVAVTNDGVEFTLADFPSRWFSLTSPDEYWHWTNVVFSSTREPVVTKTNGEWRIEFK